MARQCACHSNVACVPLSCKMIVLGYGTRAQPALLNSAPRPRCVNPPSLHTPQVLKAHGHLLPPELEARANQQRAEDRASAERQRSAALEAGAQVVVQAAPRPPAALKLERSRSQELRSMLDQPAARTALGKAAALAAEMRVLSAHSVLLAAAKQAGCSLAELAALPRQTLESVLPAGATLDVQQVIQDAAWATDTLAALEDHSGWMTSRSDALQVHYRHQRGSTVHRWVGVEGFGGGLRCANCSAMTASWRAGRSRFTALAVCGLVERPMSCAAAWRAHCFLRRPSSRSLKFAAVFEHPLEHLLALAHEFDLIVTWNK